MRSFRSMDTTLLFSVMSIVIMGVLILSSASSVFGYERFGNSYYFVWRQLKFGILPGLVLAFVASQLSMERIQKLVPLVAGIVMGLLVAVFIPGIGENLGRAQRWIQLGNVILQPSELAKLASILVCARLLSKTPVRSLNDWKQFLIPYLSVVAVIGGLIMSEPDMGTTTVIVSTMIGMLCLAGPSWKTISTILLIGIILAGSLIALAPYRLKRIETFLSGGNKDTQGAAYQVNQAVIGVSAGGVFGRGLGKSIQKFQYLPEVASDSLFVIMAEELGFVMVSLIILLLYWIIVRCFRIAHQLSDPFARAVCGGIGCWLGVQTTINIGANLGLLPFTGVPLPFLSHGGTSMMVLLTSVALVARFSSFQRVVAPLRPFRRNATVH